jgi:hypothetical protein
MARILEPLCHRDLKRNDQNLISLLDPTTFSMICLVLVLVAALDTT